MIDTTDFWENRAQRFAGEGAGLRAVCSYAMPGFYNWSLDATQRAALKELIESIEPGSEVLDYGCGVGRWTREIAARGATVTAVDFSETMLAEAQARTAAAGLGSHCSFLRSDVAEIDLARRYDLILGVTVLQHVLDDERLTQAIARLARHLKPGGRLALLEAAPSHYTSHADTATFHARTLGSYVTRLEAAGLRIREVRGVDPAPFKVWVVPRFRRWPRPFALGALMLATLCSLPIDLFLARRLTRHSWHKLIVAQAPDGVS